MRWILILTILLVSIAMAFTLSLLSKPHKNVLLENTLEPEHLQHPQVLALTKEYRQRLWQIAAVLSLFGLTSLLTSYESIMMTILLVGIFGGIGGFFACQIIYIRKMHELIMAEGWQLTKEPVLVDTKLVLTKNRKIVSPLWFIPTLLISLLGSFFVWQNTDHTSALVIILVNILIQLTMIGTWFVIRNLPVRSLTEDEDINRQMNDLTKFYWSATLIGIAAMLTPLLFTPVVSSQLRGWSAIGLTILFMLLTIGCVIWTMVMLLRLRKKQDVLLSHSASFRYNGEDEYWKYGIYINPNDPRLMIPDRVGMNISMNLGRPVAKVLAALLGIVVLVILAVCLIPIYQYDFTADPFQLTIKQQEVRLTAPLTVTSEIPLASIEEVTTIDKLSGDISRTNGYGGDNYLTGHFTVDGKKANFYIDTKSKPIIKIVTKEKDYYFTRKIPAETWQDYHCLQKLVK